MNIITNSVKNKKATNKSNWYIDKKKQKLKIRIKK